MNTVSLEEINRTIYVQLPSRIVEVEPLLREVFVDSNTRTVDVTMTYTLEEFYFVTPFELVEELKEGAIWSSE